MSLEDVVLPKQYRNAKVLFEQNLDSWRLATQEGFSNVNLNLQQLARDCFGINYDYDNDGNPNLTTSLLDLLNTFSAGGAPITGTTSTTWTIGTSAFPGTLDMSNLTAARNFFFPDVSGDVLVNDGAQSIVDMDLTQDVITGGSPNMLNLIGGAHLALAASTEAADLIFDFARTVQFSTGALTSQRAFKIMAPTYAFVGPSTLSNAATAYISGAPAAGANATITNAWAFWIDSGDVKFDDSLVVGKAFTSGYLDKGSLSGAQTVDWSAASTQKITASGDLTLTFSNPKSFQTLKLIIQQDVTGSRIITWPTTTRWLNGSGATNSTTDAPPTQTTGSKFDVYTFHWDSDLSLYIGVVSGYKGAIT